MAVTSFRRSTKSERKGGGGKGVHGNWREEMRLPKGGEPTPIFLIKGDYLDPNPDPSQIEIDLQTGQPIPVRTPYYKFLAHGAKVMTQYSPKPRYITEPCARGWDRHNPKTCAGCIAMDQGSKHIKLTEQYSVGVVHLAMYHQHPTIEKDKGVIMKKDNSGPYMRDSECKGKTCNFCRLKQGQPPILQQNEWWPQYDPNSITEVFASRRYMTMGSGHLGDLGEIDKQVSSKCRSLSYVRNQDGSFMLNQQGQPIPKGRCNSFLDVDGYACPNCNNMLINAETDPRELKVLDELALQKYPCHVCQRPVFMKEVNSCPQCGNASVVGAFDGVIWGARQGEDTMSHLVLLQFDLLEDFEANLHPVYRALLGGKPLKERIDELAKPYNFEDLHKPKEFDKMAQRLGLNLQQAGSVPGQQGFMPTGQPGVPGYVPPAQQMGYPQHQQPAPAYGGYPQAPPQQGYTPYPQGTPGTPGPAPFVPPQKPNFGS